MFRLFVLTIALCAELAPAWGASGADPATWRLTPVLLDRMDAAAAEIKQLPPLPRKDSLKQLDDEDSVAATDTGSVEDMARQMDLDSRIRAILVKHKLTSLEYAAATLAALHAGMALAMETTPGAAKQVADFTPAQRANVEVMRMRMRVQR